ncbi:MAG: hypothetical protein ACI867_002551 [Glaciecola sp.]|jgi:hypothetical protein
MDRWDFVGPLWLWEGNASWHFVTVPEDVSDAIEFRTSDVRAGFGSVRVEVTVGVTTWRTSVFPDSKRGAYVLPVKKEVRRKESLEVGSEFAIQLALVEAP